MFQKNPAIYQISSVFFTIYIYKSREQLLSIAKNFKHYKETVWNIIKIFNEKVVLNIKNPHLLKQLLSDEENSETEY